MPLWLQYTLVAIVVLAALAFLARQFWRWVRAPASGCGSHCSGAATTSKIVRRELIPLNVSVAKGSTEQPRE